jgi:hypothetical protein
MQDILAAHEFYNRQEEGLGAYFLDCMFFEIDSLAFICRNSRKDIWIP